MTRNIARSDTETPKDTWQTPDKLFRVLDQLYHFTVDACANSHNKKVNKHWSVTDTALDKDWKKEIVFCNPPFSQLAKDERWTEKFLTINDGCVILPAALDTKWFHRLLDGHGMFYIFKGRVKYEHPSSASTSPTFPTVMYFKTGRHLPFFCSMLESNGFPGTVLAHRK